MGELSRFFFFDHMCNYRNTSDCGQGNQFPFLVATIIIHDHLSLRFYRQAIFLANLFFFFLNPWDRTSHSWFQTPFVTKDDLELLTLLPVPSKCWDHRNVLPRPALANILNIWIKNFWFTNLVTLRSLLRSALSLPLPLHSCLKWVGDYYKESLGPVRWISG